MPVIAISPIVGGESLKGPLKKMLHEMSVPTSASWIAEHYRDFIDGFVLDSADESLAAEIESMGVATTVTNTVMNSLDDRVRVAQSCLEFVASLSESERSMTVSGD